MHHVLPDAFAHPYLQKWRRMYSVRNFFHFSVYFANFDQDAHKTRVRLREKCPLLRSINRNTVEACQHMVVKPITAFMKIHLVVLEVLHAERHNDNAFLVRPKTRAVPIKLAPSVRPSICPPTH
jgi:hypothetical protein